MNVQYYYFVRIPTMNNQYKIGWQSQAGCRLDEQTTLHCDNVHTDDTQKTSREANVLSTYDL